MIALQFQLSSSKSQGYSFDRHGSTSGVRGRREQVRRCEIGNADRAGDHARRDGDHDGVARLVRIGREVRHVQQLGIGVRGGEGAAAPDSRRHSTSWNGSRDGLLRGLSRRRQPHRRNEFLHNDGARRRKPPHRRHGLLRCITRGRQPHRRHRLLRRRSWPSRIHQHHHRRAGSREEAPPPLRLVTPLQMLLSFGIDGHLRVDRIAMSDRSEFFCCEESSCNLLGTQPVHVGCELSLNLL